MWEALGTSVECLVCMEIMVSAIKQCELGHSICGICADRVISCPLCKTAITSRNYKLEDVIAILKVMENKPNEGFKNKFYKRDPEDHYQKLLHSNYDSEDLSSYRYVTNKNKSTQIELGAWNTLTLEQQTTDYFDIQLILYHEADQLFWYKQKIDAHKRAVCWLFQYLEPKIKTSNYSYEFTLSHSSARTVKIWEPCESDKKSMDDLLDAGKCITIPFTTLNNYLRDDNKIYFKFKIVETTEAERPDQKINQPLGDVSTDPILPPDNNFGDAPRSSYRFAPPRTIQVNHLQSRPLIIPRGFESPFNPCHVSDNSRNRILENQTNQIPSSGQQIQHVLTNRATTNNPNVSRQRRGMCERYGALLRYRWALEPSTHNEPLELVVGKRKHFQENAPKRHKTLLHGTVIDLTV